MMRQTARTMTPILVTANAREISEAPEWVMYMPAGDSEINASVSGRASRVHVKVDKETADTLETSFNSIQSAGGPDPYVGFDHNPGPAGFWPKAFKWEEDGVYVKAEWTDTGKSGVEGRSYRYFSPTFLLNRETGKIEGLPAKGEIGSLVNNPAFRGIKAVTANETNQTNTMTDIEIDALKADNAKLNATVAALEKSLAENKKTQATAAVAAAVKAGQIAPQDTATQEKWVSLILASDSATSLLEALPKTIKVTDARLTGDATASASDKEEVIDGRAVQVRAADLAEKGIPFHVAWCQASNEAGETISKIKPQS